MVSRYLNPLRILIAVGRRANAFSTKRAKEKRYANAKAWLNHSAALPLKVNIGCGKEPFKGWTNLDLDPESRADILWDVPDGLAFTNGSCVFFYCEHFLEHVRVEDGVRFLV